MNTTRSAMLNYIFLVVAAVALWALSTIANAAPAAGAPDTDTAAAAFRARHDALGGQFAVSPFKRPLVLESQHGSHDLKGDIYAVIPHPFAKVNAALGGSEAWCDVLILHLNTKYCRVERDGAATTLQMNVGKKFDQPLEDSYRLAFVWRTAIQRADYLKVNLIADSGPLGTRNYQITLEAVPLDGGRTFLHLGYAYGFGTTGNLAMKAYLSTIGRNKVGFTVARQDDGGQPVYVDGMRGLVERNTMRYYLAIEAYLGALTLPPRAQFEKRINDWFAAVERYPRQLHEMEQAEYLEMKRKEYRRQQRDDKAGLPGQG